MSIHQAMCQNDRINADNCVFRAGRQLTLSLEMFERDVQGVMDEYLAGSITERDLRQVRNLTCL